MIKSVLTFIIAIFTALAATAQVSFTVSVPPRVTVGQNFAVTFTLKNADGNSLKVKQVPGVSLIYGPSTTTSMSSQIYNGHQVSSSRIDYTYYYKVTKEGKFSIGEASIIADGKTYRTSAVTVNAVESPQGQQQQQQQQSVDFFDVDTQSADKPVNAKDVFVRIILSKNTAYEQEAIDCTIKLYTKYQISQFFPTRQPSFDGFLIQELDVQPELNEEELYNGERYATAILKKCIIFPQKSGKLTINSGNYDVSVRQFVNVNMGFFTVRDPQEREIKITSNSASINIKPLPSPQPEGFNGAVGKFTAESRLVGNSFRTNDASTLIYTIKGTGNIKYLKEPVIDFPDEFEQYTPKVDYNTSVQGQNVNGTMTVEYTFVPQSVGDFKIGSDKFVYFDPDSKEYVTINTPVYNIKVSKGASAPISDADRKDIQIKNTDILHIITGEKNPSKNHTLVASTWWYIALYPTSLAALIIVMAMYRSRARKALDIAGSRLAKANKVARKRLRLAKQSADAGHEEKFYQEMTHAIWGYIGDKLNIPVSQLTRENATGKLLAAGVPQDTIDKLMVILDTCEMAQYTPQKSSDAMTSLYNDATQAINATENIKIKK